MTVKNLVVGILMTAGSIIPNMAFAKLAFQAEGSNSYIQLYDDRDVTCPHGTLLAKGKDTNGVEYRGCWGYDSKSKEIVLLWVTPKPESMNFPLKFFQVAEEPI